MNVLLIAQQCKLNLILFISCSNVLLNVKGLLFANLQKCALYALICKKRSYFQLLSFWQRCFQQLTHVSCFVSLSNIFSLVYNLTLNRLTNEQRLQIIEFYYQNACSVKKENRALLSFYGQFNRATEAIRAIVTKFRTKFTLLDIKQQTRLRRVRTEENIAAESASVNDDHQLSIRRRWQQFGLCYSTT